MTPPDPAAAEAVKLRLSESFAGAREPVEILRTVAEIVGRHLGVSRVAYGEIEPGEDAILIPAEWTDGVGPMIGRHPLHRGSGFVREYVRGRTVATGDVDAMDLVAAERAMMAETQCRACISVPLLRDGELVALFSATHRGPRAWRADEIALVEHAAARTWSALEHSRVIERLRASEAAMGERDRHQTFLIDWTDRVRQESDPAAITRLTVTRLAEHFGVSRSGYAVAEDAGDEAGAALRIVAEARANGDPTLGLAYSLDRLGGTIAQDFRAGRMVRFDDAGADPRLSDKLRGFAQAIGLGSDMSMPLIAGGRLKGVLSVTQQKPRAWTAGEAQLLREVAARMWTILEKAEAQSALAARERHGAFLLDWSDGVRDIEGEAAIIEFTLARIGGYLGTSRANFAEIAGDGAQARISVRQEWFRDGHTGETRAAVSEGVVDAYLGGAVVAVEDVTTDPRFDEAARAHYLAVEAASFLAAPMMSGGRVQGFLSVQDARARRWHPFERQLLRDIADRTWGLTERARVAATLAARERDQTFLLAWSDEVRALATPEAIVETTLARLREHLSASRACHSDIQMDGGSYRIVAESRHDTIAVKGLVYPSSNLSDEVRRIYLSGAALVVDDMPNDARFSAPALAGFARAEVGARISVPLSRGGEVQAILAIDAKAARRWTEQEVALVRDVADRMWTQMERVRAEAALRERERHQAQLLAWTDRMREERTAWGMLTATLDQLGHALGATRINYAETGDDGQTLHVLQEWNSGVASVADVEFPLAALGPAVRGALESGETFVAEDIPTDPRFDAEARPLYAEIGVVALLSVALVRGGRVIANLAVQQDHPRKWRPSDVALFVDLAERTWSLLERRRSEERLNESEALLAAFMENAPIAMYLKDTAGRYVRVNREMAVVLGCGSTSEALGRTTHDFMPEDVAGEVTRLDRAALDGGVHATELEIAGRDRYTHALSVRFAVPGYDGRVGRLGGFVIDLTERRRTEAELEQSRASLFQTEKLSALGSLLAGVSHELNNPLSIVVAQSVMLERQTAGSPLAERAAKVRKAADRCARIVQTFLAMARQKRPERKPADLNDIAAAAVELTSYGVRADGIEVALQLADGLPQISADSDQLHQVIVNLVVNAQQAMVDAGDAVRRGGRITVRTALGLEPGTVIFEVADTGPGVPEEARRRIFEPFFTTKPQGQGTGVGLSFSQGLVEAHGGRLALVPSSKGAVFRATLPVERDRTLAPVAPEPVAEPVAPVERRALVVDDEPEIAEALADFLSIEGYSCEVAIGGAAAIVKIEAGAYDLVVSDIRMPGVDGPQLHAWMTVERPDLLDRLAFATGDTLGATAANFLADVKRPVLEKPFTPQAVRDFVRRMEGA